MPVNAQADVDVMNEAFLDLGAQSIQTFEDEVDGLQDIGRRYRTVVGAALSDPSFPYSVRRVQLSRISAPSETGYAYNFQSSIAGDVLALYNSASSKTPVHDFRVIDGIVNTDMEAAWAEILKGSDPASWPPYVRNMIVACLKAEFCFAITGDRLLARDLRLTAYGPPGEDPDGGLVKSARMRASQQQAGGQLTLGPDPLTSARYR